MMTKTEKEIIELLKVHPLIPIRNRWQIAGQVVNGSTIKRMKQKGLITIGIHPGGDKNKNGFVVADQTNKAV